jgi:secreted Zn-dependent insulinase-like peptidase
MAQQNAFEYFDSINKFANENQSIKIKQTAVAWIEDNIQSDMTFMEIMGLIRQAKAMEKEQIMDAYENGVSDENESNLSGLFTNAEQYYNETYNK